MEPIYGFADPLAPLGQKMYCVHPEFVRNTDFTDYLGPETTAALSSLVGGKRSRLRDACLVGRGWGALIEPRVTIRLSLPLCSNVSETMNSTVNGQASSVSARHHRKLSAFLPYSRQSPGPG